MRTIIAITAILLLQDFGQSLYTDMNSDSAQWSSSVSDMHPIQGYFTWQKISSHYTSSVTGAFAVDHFTNCGWVHNRQCYDFGFEQLCATDGITYNNRCYFSQAYCHDTFLHVTHAGPCFSVSGGVTTTPSVEHVTDATTKDPLYYGPDAVLDFFCIHLSHENCTLIQDEICGSDNITYINPCEFEKERCSHRDLHVMHFGHC